jgi:MFS family permease
MIVLGIGLGATMPIFTLAVQSAFPKERLGEVTAGTQLFRSIGGTVGTAILGGIMNSRLTAYMNRLQNEPFLAQLKQFDRSSSAGHFDGSFIQTILNQDGQKHIKDMLGKVPEPYKEDAVVNFNHFIASAKVSFSNAVDGVFLVAGCIMAVALVIVFFLPEIPLRKSSHPAMEEAGIMLEDELGNADDDCQPRVQAASSLGSSKTK